MTFGIQAIKILETHGDLSYIDLETIFNVQRICSELRNFGMRMRRQWRLTRSQSNYVYQQRLTVPKFAYYLQNYIHTLNLGGTQVTNVSALGNVHTLILNDTLVTDVSALGNVHKINLGGTQVTDVSALGNVHTLSLSGTQVTDVSALGHVHTLYLYNCRVTDVSALQNVKKLMR